MKTLMKEWFFRKGKAVGRLQDQQHPAASWVLRQQPHAALHTPQIHHFSLTGKITSLVNSLSNVTVDVMNVPFFHL